MSYTFEDELIDVLDEEAFAAHTEAWEHADYAEELRRQFDSKYMNRLAVQLV